MTENQANLILDILHHLSEQVDTIREDTSELKVQTALNTESIKRHTEQTSAIQSAMTACRNECDIKLESALQATRYIKWFSATAVGVCTILVAVFEVINRVKP